MNARRLAAAALMVSFSLLQGLGRPIAGNNQSSDYERREFRRQHSITRGGRCWTKVSLLIPRTSWMMTGQQI